MTGEPVYEILSPIGAERSIVAGSGQFSPAPPLPDLNGRTIALIWTEFTNGDVLLDAFEALLGERYQSLHFVRMAPGRNTEWGGSPDPTLTDLVREQGIEAAIIAAGC